jgi:hypothetical protein
MKILLGNEPLFCEEHEFSYNIMMQLSGAGTRDEFLSIAKLHMPFNFDAMVCLFVMRSDLNCFVVQCGVSLLNGSFYIFFRETCVIGKKFSTNLINIFPILYILGEKNLFW